MASARESDLLTKLRKLRHHNRNLAIRNTETREQACQILQQICVRMPGTKLMSEFGGISLAIRRNRVGHVSREAALALMAGDDLSGGIKDPAIITKYEMRAAAAVRLDFAEQHQTFIQRACEQLPPPAAAPAHAADAADGGGDGAADVPAEPIHPVRARRTDTSRASATLPGDQV